jgi:hypothetical protein
MLLTKALLDKRQFRFFESLSDEEIKIIIRKAPHERIQIQFIFPFTLFNDHF